LVCRIDELVRAAGETAERGVTPLGAKLPEAPGMRRPPEEGGPR
jgi:hypothetical protein